MSVGGVDIQREVSQLFLIAGVNRSGEEREKSEGCFLGLSS